MKKTKVSQSALWLLACISVACSAGDEDGTVSFFEPKLPLPSSDVKLSEVALIDSDQACGVTRDNQLLCTDYRYGGTDPTKLTGLMWAPTKLCEAAPEACLLDQDSLDAYPWRLVRFGLAMCAYQDRLPGLVCWGDPQDITEASLIAEFGSVEMKCAQVSSAQEVCSYKVNQEFIVDEITKFAWYAQDGTRLPGSPNRFDEVPGEAVEPIRDAHHGCVLDKNHRLHCLGEPLTGNEHEYLTLFGTTKLSMFVPDPARQERLCGLRLDNQRIDCRCPSRLGSGCSAQTYSDVFVELKALEHVCGITAIGELICYGAQDVSSDPFGYGERQNEQGELLRALVRCDGEQCVAAETYATLDLSGRFSDAFIAEGCAIRSDGRPHCFGLYSTQRSCGEYDATQADLENACFERIF